jgi:hypothetical protein
VKTWIANVLVTEKFSHERRDGWGREAAWTDDVDGDVLSLFIPGQ